MSTPKNIPPDQFRPGDMLELALSIFNSNEPPVRTLEEIRLHSLRRRRERAHRRLVTEMAQRRAERKERLKGAKTPPGAEEPVYGHVPPQSDRP
jgi:hypothetical protein